MKKAKSELGPWYQGQLVYASIRLKNEYKKILKLFRNPHLGDKDRGRKMLRRIFSKQKQVP